MTLWFTILTAGTNAICKTGRYQFLKVVGDHSGNTIWLWHTVTADYWSDCVFTI